MNEKVKDKLLSLFNKLDKDGSGNISLEELSLACSDLSIKLTEDEKRRFLRADSSGDRLLDFEEFCSFYTQSLQGVFDNIDKDKSGEISVAELEDAFKRLGQSVNGRELKALLAQVDKDKNGRVDFNEFSEYFISLPSPSVRAVLEQWSSGLSVDVGSDLAPPVIPPPSMKIGLTLFAGGTAGIVSRTATAPLEKIKILAQTNGEARLVSTFNNIIKMETWRGLYAGNGLNCLRVLPFSGLVCLAYANIAQYFPLDGTSDNVKVNTMVRMGVGAFAGCFATILTHPIDLIRAQVTIDTANKHSLAQRIRIIYQQEQLRGLYKGLGPTLLAIAPFIAVQQASYDLLKHKATLHGLTPSPMLFLTCGALAGATAQTAVYPLDVIRRRLQVSGAAARSLRELFSGLSVTYLKIMPSVAISLLVRDALLGRLKK
ncbi:PREDICTED: calcium-binding mitochondrial carrier protein SCaMC-1-like [Amphimedon queenslandica]|uniref:EF-hand domain-containing protein n=1 Tax=Amphimedon queenslandica TaxID=400682 RepID=A0A1X7VP08_AMPQE|nr:PREDICTED: calcium-binding mitochondrial carrier protein SCaMC-1-like [Amphimedon queenslandica]|eukprot:XP_011409833.1 PREDICTED: calcium-binding mitochondrial carrier protein SCaMC-1-like [Amphimedon queenslandica]